MRQTAITHAPSPRMQDCQRTFVEHASIDLEKASRQHASYRRKLSDLGLRVETLSVNAEHPDCAFIEDLAIVLDEIAVVAAMGTASRAAEPGGLEDLLQGFRETIRVEPPATIEGGDVLRVGRALIVGQSTRTNRLGIASLERIVRPHGYRVISVPVRECLHFKTACTALPDGSLLVNPAWCDTALLRDFEQLAIPSDEPWAANTLVVGPRVLMADGHARTTDMLRRRGINVDTVDISEFAKAEGGVTCLSVFV